ncbi:hypothetical protein D3C87_1120020 [compost metagenome]
MRRHARARLVQRGEEDLQAIAGVTNQVGTRHAAVVEGQRRRAGGTRTHLVFQPHHGQPWRVLFKDQHRDALLGTSNALPLAEQQVEIGHIAIGDEGLATIDDDLVAVLPEGGPHAGGVRAGPRLGDGQRTQTTLSDARQQPLLLLLGAPVDQRLHAVVIGGPDDPGGRARFTDLSHATQVGGVRHLGTAISFRNEHGVQAHLIDGLHMLPWELGAAVVVLGARRDLVARQCPDALQQHVLLIIEGDSGIQSFEDVHGFSERWLGRHRRKWFRL